MNPEMYVSRISDEFEKERIIHKFDVLLNGTDPNDFTGYPSLEMHAKWRKMFDSMTKPLSVNTNYRDWLDQFDARW